MNKEKCDNEDKLKFYAKNTKKYYRKCSMQSSPESPQMHKITVYF